MAPQVTKKKNNENRDLSPGEDRVKPSTNLLDSAIHLPFFKRPESVAHFTGRQPATLLRSALKVLESAKYPTIQFRHITGPPSLYTDRPATRGERQSARITVTVLPQYLIRRASLVFP